MKEIVLTEQSKSTHKLWQNASWYRALTLSERVAMEQNNTYDTASHSEIARQRLRLWKEQPPFNKDTYFAQRLAMDGLTEDDLLSLLSEPAEHLQARCSTPPAWLLELATAFDEQDTDDDFALPLQHITDDTMRTFVLVLKPLLRRGCMRLQTGIHELSHKYTHLPFDPETILPLLFKRICFLTVPRISKTIILELHVARAQERLQGETPQERFQNFFDFLTQGNGILSIFEEYPVLARWLVETIERWVTCNLEFLERLCADWEQIREVFTPDQDPGMLTDIKEGLGDVHRNGRSVILADWSSGFRLVYKPRSLATDTHFQEVLTWLNSRGYQPAFRTLKLINKETYGWVEFVHAHGCTSAAEIERFYLRQGGYLALLHALEASDFHAENLIASGEYPIPIDLETLFHPRVGGYDEFLHKVPGNAMMFSSVSRTGLLPRHVWSTDDSKGVDHSGLGGLSRQSTPDQISVWTEIGTDQMHLTKGQGEIIHAHHRPLLNGEDVDTLDYCETVITGFTSLYRLLMQHRDEFITEILPRFAHDEIRCLLRPTRHYGLLQTNSFHPNVLRDALDRERLFDRLWINVQHQYHLPRLIPAERFDLLNNDVPLFFSYPNSRDLFTSQGDVITELFGKPGLETAKENMQKFDESELEKQIWVIRASFTSLALGKDDLKRFLHLQPAQHEATPAQLITAARAVGDRLVQLAIYSGDAAGWLGVMPMGEREWSVAPADSGLYSGAAGIALFLGYLGMLTGEEKYTALALAALKCTRRQIEGQLKRPEVCQVGAFSGLSGFIYLLSHLGTLWNMPELYQEAKEIVKQLPGIIKHDKAFDILGGSAGCIAALLSLYSVAPSADILTAALQCGDHLIANAKPMQVGIGWSTKTAETPLSGFSHGNAGMALSLLHLFGVTKEERFREAALAAMHYERSLFSPEQQNWRDLRKSADEPTPDEQEASSMIAWCHGAAGIGLGRLESLQYIDDATIRTEIDVAVKTTLTRGFGSNHSLCHGDMGNIELPLAAAQVLGDPKLQQMVRQLAASLLESIETQGWITGIPMGIETPGLMTGLAGTGYMLLRLAAPNRVPSVLTLAKPC